MDCKPTRQTMLPYGKQWIDEDDIRAVVEVLRSDYLTTGPKVREFEAAFADYAGAKFAVAVANGTAALHAAAFAAGIGPGDEVVTTPITFAASANCVLYMGAKPVFADIDARTYNIDPAAIRKKITPQTKAVIPVHFTGQPVDLDAVHDLAREFGLTVIEDAAHALGAEHRGRRIGGLSDLTIFSFHPVKHITTGEGGMVTTNDPILYQRLIRFRNHGITREPERMNSYEGLWYYEELDLGFNYRLTDFQAALGLSQLRKIEAFVHRRTEIALHYTEAFQGLPGLIAPYQAPGCRTSWHLYVVQFDPEVIRADRTELFNRLRRLNIGVNVHYIPVYYHPYYQRIGYERGLCPAAESFYGHAMTLPLYPAMTDEDVQDVITAVRDVWHGMLKSC